MQQRVGHCGHELWPGAAVGVDDRGRRVARGRSRRHGDLAEAQRAGINKVLQKPLSAADLRTRLLALLEPEPGPDTDSAFTEI